MGAAAPRVSLARRYERGWLRGDLLAGVTVAAYVIPQVKAYTEVAGLPAVVSLWASVAAMLVYAAFGSSGCCPARGAVVLFGPGHQGGAVAAKAIGVGPRIRARSKRFGVKVVDRAPAAGPTNSMGPAIGGTRSAAISRAG